MAAADVYNEGMIHAWMAYQCPISGIPGTEYLPLQLPPTPRQVQIVYSGINPSFRVTKVKQYADDVQCPMTYFDWYEGIDDSEVAKRRNSLIRFEQHARKNYRTYFSPFEKFSKDVGVDPAETTHVDVLALRVNEQADLVNAVERYQGERDVDGFIRAQRMVYAATLKELAPRVVLIANARAARWIRDHLRLQHDESKRRYRWNDAPNTTFFLAGQLSGGRTDEFSRDRLVADVKDVLAR